jgi:hypothetical protein
MWRACENFFLASTSSHANTKLCKMNVQRKLKTTDGCKLSPKTRQASKRVASDFNNNEE